MILTSLAKSISLEMEKGKKMYPRMKDVELRFLKMKTMYNAYVFPDEIDGEAFIIVQDSQLEPPPDGEILFRTDPTETEFKAWRLARVWCEEHHFHVPVMD